MASPSTLGRNRSYSGPLPQALIENSVENVLQQYQLASAAIAGVSTIELKQDEAGLLAFCQKRQLPLKTYSAAHLRTISVPHPLLLLLNKRLGLRVWQKPLH